MKILSKYEVIRDTREQTGWWFNPSNECLGTIEQTLPTGDYTLRGLEKILCIERKGCTSEFATNINEKRFDKELKRMDEFDHAFLLLDFTPADIEQFPINSGIPKSKYKSVRVSPNYLRSKIADYSIRYNIKILFTGGNGPKYMVDIFRKMWLYYSPLIENGEI